jgi:hypothetical protein
MGLLSNRPNGPVIPANSVPPNAINVQATLVPGPLPATLTLVSSTETLVKNPNNPTIPLSIALVPDTNLEQGVFDLWASGTITTGTTTNLTINLYEGTTITSGNLLGTTSTVAQNGTSGARVTAAFWVHLVGMIDSVSGTLVGTAGFYINKTLVATATLSNFVTGFLNQDNPSANPPTVAVLPTFSLSFTSSGATASAGASTVVNVQQFSCG